MGSTSSPEAEVADIDVAAAVRLLHRRHAWSRTAVISLFAFLLAAGASANAGSEGTPAPSWFADIIIVLAALTAVSIIAMAVDSARLRRTAPGVRAQAAQVTARHPGSPRAHHYPSRHQLIWAVRWVGMLLILLVAVVSVPAPVDGVAYLAGAEGTNTFYPVSYQTHCQYTCDTSTDGYLETGSARISASWPKVVPLGKPLHVREPVWRWGLGEALIDSDGTAVIAIAVSLLIEVFGVLVMLQVVRLVRNWRRHRDRQTANAYIHVA